MTSQLGQDYFVLQLLNGKRNGYFLDSGAADGIRASNTFLLERKFGWKGICIEPNDNFYSNLIKNRLCHCVNCCLFDVEGTVQFLEASTLGGIFSEYHPAILNQIRNTKELSNEIRNQFKTISKKTRTILSILTEFKAPKFIDYWSLDTEGSELTILKSFPFDKYIVKIITVEHNYLPIRKDIKLFLEKIGYKRYMQMGIDDCYVYGNLNSFPLWRSTVWKRIT